MSNKTNKSLRNKIIKFNNLVERLEVMPKSTEFYGDRVQIYDEVIKKLAPLLGEEQR